jgi:hypothetical protein
MSRKLLLICGVLAVASPTRADRMAPIASPVERALRSPVVIVGKVTSVEKDTVDAILYPGATNKMAHKIAIVKVETNLAGADGVTHFRVGFVPHNPALRRGPENPALAEGQEWLFFLTRSAGGEFHAIPYMTPPLETNAAGAKEQIESVKKTLAMIADPMKSLKAEKPEDRHAAALALVVRYRTPPEGTREVETVAIPADESKLILKALAEGEWKSDPRGERMNALTAFYSLGLGDADGWKYPAPKPGEDATEVLRTTFVKWLDGPGKNYAIKKIVAKKTK